jgi:hypothetical protein
MREEERIDAVWGYGILKTPAPLTPYYFSARRNFSVNQSIHLKNVLYFFFTYYFY